MQWGWRGLDCVSVDQVWKDLITGESQPHPCTGPNWSIIPCWPMGSRSRIWLGAGKSGTLVHPQNPNPPTHPSRVICLWCVLTRARRTARGNIHLSTERGENFFFFFFPLLLLLWVFPGALRLPLPVKTTLDASGSWFLPCHLSSDVHHKHLCCKQSRPQ